MQEPVVLVDKMSDCMYIHTWSIHQYFTCVSLSHEIATMTSHIEGDDADTIINKKATYSARKQYNTSN